MGQRALEGSLKETERQLQYTSYIGDGDKESFSAIQRADPYNGKKIKKCECVATFKSALAQLCARSKVSSGQKKLSDGKSIDGYGRLTADRIDKLQTYYGLAICRYKEDLDGMKKVWAD